MGRLIAAITNNPMVIVYIALAAFVLGLGAGATPAWIVQGWRFGAQVARLEGQVETQKQSLATFEGANKRCTASVAEVKASVKELADESIRKSAAAAVAAQAAAKAAEGHLVASRAALNRAMPPPGKECETAASEASAYAKKRKEAR